MKAIIVLLVVGGLALGAMYMFGGYSSFDPDKQADAARAAIKPGMTLKQVADAAGKNPRYQAINKITKKVGGETIEEETPGTPVAFDFDKVSQRLKDNQLPSGFILTYTFSEAKAFSVTFDGAGAVTSINDAFTVSDLYNGKLPGMK